MKRIKSLFLFLLSVITIVITISIPVSASYTVKSGDTMYGIARKYKMQYSDLVTLNPQISNKNKINIGDAVVVRTGNTANDITDFAKALQTVTVYQYGGQNPPYKTDCSGWTQYIYKQFNIDLPRVSKEQANTGTPVTFKQLRKGDLMFFSTRTDKVISHVGIYLGDELWISNLSSKQSVTILSIYSPWTQKYFLWGQRVI